MLCVLVFRLSRPSACSRQTVFAAPTLRQSKQQWAAQHHADAEVFLPCIMCLVVFLGACALSLCEGKKSGTAQPAVSLYVPSTQGPGAQTGFLRVRVPTDRSSKRSKLYNTTTSREASFPWIQALVPAFSSGQTNPILAIIDGTRFPSKILQQSSGSSSTLSGNVRTFCTLVDTQTVLQFPDRVI